MNLREAIEYEERLASELPPNSIHQRYASWLRQLDMFQIMFKRIGLITDNGLFDVSELAKCDHKIARLLLEEADIV